MFSPDQKPVFGEKTKKLREIFEGNNFNNWLTSHELRKCLHILDIYPAESQVVEYVHDACQISERLEKNISFGEFCYIVSVLEDEYRKCSADRKSPNKIPPKCKQCGDFTLSSFQVFLGGSCNPTTWRGDTVIPFLMKHNLTFYNPQRDDWSEELVQQETEAKDRAEVLFFVIDNVTRSTASMVESANLAAKGKPLILIIKRFDGPHKQVAGEKLSEIEYEDLCRSHAYLTHLVERRGIPVFSDIDVALECLRRVLHEDIPLEELTLKDGAIPVKHPHVRISDKFRQIKQAFGKYGADYLNRDEINEAFKYLTSADLPKWVWHSSGPDKKFNLQEFYCLVTEFKNERQLSVASILRGIVRLPIVIYDWLIGRSQNCPELIRTKSVQDYDVFLGGTCADSLWREEIAIPLLEKAGLTYYNPKKQEWTTRYIAREASVKDHCKALLYVITSQTRGITSMLEAAYYSGLGRKVIFCILSINTKKISGEELTENAIKDYNRARTYLFEITQECPHFQNIEDAVKEAVRTVQEQNY